MVLIIMVLILALIMALTMVPCWSLGVALLYPLPAPLLPPPAHKLFCAKTEIQSRYLVILQSVKTAEVNFAVKEIKP